MNINGNLIDGKGRCVHYSSDKDIVAIQFKCCGKFYSCYKCHDELENHPAERWEEEEFSKQAIACGNCYETLAIDTYMTTNNCPNCEADFNPNCEKHHHLYFELIESKV